MRFRYLRTTSNFNSHPHEEDDRAKNPGEKTYSHFNSHPHEEDDLTFSASSPFHVNFNSHPHEEDDSINCERSDYYDISTHILTKRMTIFSTYNVLCTSISTHILTKRMTLFVIIIPRKICISTHILTKRMTILPPSQTPPYIFQLTSSRRG